VSGRVKVLFRHESPLVSRYSLRVGLDCAQSEHSAGALQSFASSRVKPGTLRVPSRVRPIPSRVFAVRVLSLQNLGEGTST